jgi:hypothetical protein
VKRIAFVFTAFSILLFLQNTVHADNSDKQTDLDGSARLVGHHVPTSDPNIVYSHYAQTGGKEIRTKNSYFAFCQVWVQTTISKLFANGFPRINPDNTYYPGDGFSYSFSYGWAGNKGCRNFKVCPVESNLGGEAMRCDLSKISHDKSAKMGSSSGSAELTTMGGNLQLTVAAERYFCLYPKKAKVVCGWTTITSTGSYTPQVITPSVEIVVTQDLLTDKDGFESGNLDETYYLWDAITLVHDPQYRWKQERFGTLSVVITKRYDLKLEQEFQCNSVLCTQTLSHHGFEPWQRTHQYGGGMTLLNATKQDELGRHHVLYTAELFNLGRLIHMQKNTAEFLVVRYEPVYTNYPYLVLRDGHAFSWGNRVAVALYYHGSTGGGPDDTQTIHEKRRSKINKYEYVGHAFDPITKRDLNQTLSWSSSAQAQASNDCFDVQTDSLLSGKKDSAVFVKKGFGKITFSYPILHTMLSKRYSNATLENTLQSSSFAGFETKNLTSYKYQYPDLKFNNPVKILSYHSDGSKTALPVVVEMVPDAARGANYTHDYVYSKISRDTGRAEFAAIVVGDMYDKENLQSGSGHVNLRSKLTSTWFPPFYNILADDVFDLELNVGYGAPSPYKINITVGEKTRTVYTILNFLSPFTHIVNLDEDNTLDVESDLGFVRILPNEKFGEIANIIVNGLPLNKDCTNRCTTTIPSNQDLRIEAWNLWGGRAVAFVEKQERQDSTTQYDWSIFATVIFVAAVGWLAYKLSVQAMNHFRKYL